MLSVIAFVVVVSIAIGLVVGGVIGAVAMLDRFRADSRADISEAQRRARRRKD